MNLDTFEAKLRALDSIDNESIRRHEIMLAETIGFTIGDAAEDYDDRTIHSSSIVVESEPGPDGVTRSPSRTDWSRLYVRELAIHLPTMNIGQEDVVESYFNLPPAWFTYNSRGGKHPEDTGRIYPHIMTNQTMPLSQAFKIVRSADTMYAKEVSGP